MPSLGIIGGADGPTAILVSSAPFPFLSILLFAAGIFLVTLLGRRILKGKGKK